MFFVSNKLKIKKQQQNSFQHKVPLLISVSKETSIMLLQLLIRDDLTSDHSSFLKNKMKFMHVSKVYATNIYILK